MQTLTSASVIGHPTWRRVAPARRVAAGHRDRAAGHRDRAGPRLGAVAGLAGRRPGAPDVRAADLRGVLAQGLEALPGDQAVAVRQRREHAPGLHREGARAHARVDPYDPVSEPREARHLTADERGVAALPAVGEDHDDGAAGHATPAVAVVERLQRV